MTGEVSFPLQQSIALVTGAGRGIGRATALLLADRGARVGLMSRSKDELESTAREISTRHGEGRSLALCGDVSDEAFIEESFSRMDQAFGSMNCLVNNAGVLLRTPIAALSLEEWNRTLAVNVTGAFLCAKHAFPRMRRAGGGSIVNVSSLSGIRGTPKFEGFGAYIASKHAIVGLTEALSVEGKASRIRANCVAPGAVDTKMLRTAVPEFKTETQPGEIAQVIAYLCDPSVSGALTGAVIEVNTNA